MMSKLVVNLCGADRACFFVFPFGPSSQPSEELHKSGFA